MRHGQRLVLAAFVLALAADAAAQPWSPVRVRRDAACRAHFFDTSGMGAQAPVVPIGYGNVSFGEALDPEPNPCRQFQKFHDEGVTFLRLWMRPSDGFFAYEYLAGTVDVDRPRQAFFDRLESIVDCANRSGIILEVMLWDASTPWRGPLLSPSSWLSCGDEHPGQGCRNVHHPSSNVRGFHGGGPIPGIDSAEFDKIDFPSWYQVSGGDGSWWHYQTEYLRLVLERLRRYPNVTVEIMNETADLGVADAWRQAVHGYLKSVAPELLLQSESISWARDDAFRGQNVPNCLEGGGAFAVDMVSDHLPWHPVTGGDCGLAPGGPEASKTYARAACRYERYRGILVGANEVDPGALPWEAIDFDNTRHLMWGLVMAGGVPYIENFHKNAMPDVDEVFGRSVTQEISRFFNSPSGPPAVERMMPRPSLVVGNDGHRYVLATDNSDEILVFVDDVAGNGTFSVVGNGAYSYQWFRADGPSSAYLAPQWAVSWTFTPPDSNPSVRWALRIHPEDVQVSSIPGSGSNGGGGGGGGSIPGTGPSGLTLVGDREFVNLSWKNGTAPAQQIRILHWSSVDANWQRINTLYPPVPPIQSTETHVGTGPNGITHCYVVRYFFGAGQPFYDSNQACVKMYNVVPPAPPVPIAPKNCVDTMRPLFSWQAAAKATGYYLVVKRVDDEAILVNDKNITGTTFVPKWDLTPGMLLKWKIKACNNWGCSTTYSNPTFFTSYCPPTQPPILVDTPDCVGASPTLSWQPVPGADGFRVYLVETTPGVANPETRTAYPSTTSYTVSPPLPPGKEFRWKVRADHGAGTGPWSNSKYFTVGCTAGMRPGTAAVWAPFGPVTTPEVTYTWEPARDAVDYFLQVWTPSPSVAIVREAWFSGAEICQGRECTVTPAFGLPPGNYAWWVKARNVNGLGEWSSNLPFSFGVPVTVSVNDVSVVEGGAGLTKATFTVSLSSAMTIPVSVDFATADCTAEAESDYFRTDGRVTFYPGGARHLPVEVFVKGDGLPEGDEHFRLDIGNPINIAIAKSSGQGTIRNDDGPPPPAPRADFDADGATDLVLRDDSTGNHAVWFLRDGIRMGSAMLSPAQPAAAGWSLVGVADFDSNGKPDLLWWNEASGVLSFWLLDGVTRTTGTTLAGLSDTSWKVVATADLDRDGKPDLVYRHADGRLKGWLLNGTAFRQEVGFSPEATDPAFLVAAAGDVDHDGTPDLVLRRTRTGELSYRTLAYDAANGRLNMAAPLPVTSAGVPDTSWRIASFADLDGNGSPDLVWQNATSNRIVVWYMDGAAQSCGTFLDPDGSLEPGAKVVGPK